MSRTGRQKVLVAAAAALVLSAGPVAAQAGEGKEATPPADARPQQQPQTAPQQERPTLRRRPQQPAPAPAPKPQRPENGGAQRTSALHADLPWEPVLS